MSLVWDISLPASEKIVLLALADNANDEGICWPSIATIARKSSKSERTVQAAIQSLKEAGLLSRQEVVGKGCRYTVHPSRECTPAVSAPPKSSRGTPAAAAPKPSKNHHSSEANASSERARSTPNVFPRPAWADAQVWADFMANRKRKRLANSATAYKAFLQDIDRHTNAEWTPDRLLEHAAAKGWGGIYDPAGDRKHGSRNGSSGDQTVFTRPGSRAHEMDIACRDLLTRASRVEA